MPNLKEQIAEANQRAGINRQRIFAKKSVVRQTADQVIDNLCSRAQDVLEIFYKEKGSDAMREAMRNLQSAVNIAEKRIRQ